MKCTPDFWLYNVGDLKLMICITQPEIWSKVHSALGVERYKDTNLCILYSIPASTYLSNIGNTGAKSHSI